jgi:ubiquinone/menaquinone biosynthesis C-methylase UbiE
MESIMSRGFAALLSNAQEKQWYKDFLDPVVETIPESARVLDIGTGPGMLIKRLATEKSADVTGSDIDSDMLEYARSKIKNIDAKLIKLTPGGKLPFTDNTFDAVTLCSVLFLMPEQSMKFLIDEALRVTKPGGSIVSLTPSGKKSVGSLINHVLNLSHYTFFIWNSVTGAGGSTWRMNMPLEKYAEKQQFPYNRRLVFNDLAILESVTKAVEV